MKNSLTYSLSKYYIITNLAPYQVSKALKLLYKKSLLHYILVIVASLMWTLFFGPGVLCPLSFKTSSMNPPKVEKASILSASSSMKIIDLSLGYFIKSRAALIRHGVKVYFTQDILFLRRFSNLDFSFYVFYVLV